MHAHTQIQATVNEKRETITETWKNEVEISIDSHAPDGIKEEERKNLVRISKLNAISFHVYVF